MLEINRFPCATQYETWKLILTTANKSIWNQCLKSCESHTKHLEHCSVGNGTYPGIFEDRVDAKKKERKYLRVSGGMERDRENQGD